MTLSLDEEIRRGDILRKILQTEEFVEAVALARTTIFHDWAEAKTTAAREEQHANLRGLEYLMDRLRGLADSGEHARHTLQREDRKPRG